MYINNHTKIPARTYVTTHFHPQAAKFVKIRRQST